MRRKKNLITIIIIAIVLIAIFIYFSPSHDKPTDTTYTTNSYVNNHNVVHNSDTDADALNVATSSKAREKFTKIIGDNKDEVNVMVYIIGTDLESGYGAATTDINEMLHAEINDNINIIIQTGGCKDWQNTIISNRYLERYTINSQGLLRLDTNIKEESMTNEETLTSFISYCKENYPTANRNILILWDHGGGSAVGYGYDEKYPSSPSMSPDVIARALKASDMKFDLIGFDACLMANLETAIAIEPYADYLVASEETEPGGGWYYTNWLKALDDNTSMPTVEIGKIIIDDYIDYSLRSSRNAEVTQSMIDLGDLVASINEPIIKFSNATNDKLNSDDYQTISIARSNTKEFSRESYIDQVDLVDLVERFNVDGSEELSKAIKSAIKYNRTANINDAYGLSAYFPYSSLRMVNNMVDIYDNININKEYSTAVKSFASYAASGQIVTSNQSNNDLSIFDILMGNDYYSNDGYSDNIFDILNDAYYPSDNYYGYDNIFGNNYDSWFSYDDMGSMYDYYSRSNIFNPSKLNIINKNKQRVVSLNEEEWNLINQVTLNMFIDDGKGFIDLGKDNVFDWNEEGDLIVDNEGTWLSINDHVVAYYLVSDINISENENKIVGYIPAYLNNDAVYIIVNFINDEPIILGAKKIYDNSIQAKGLIEIKDNDEIKFICDYYSYDGEYINEYQIGDTLIVNGKLEVNDVYLDNNYIYTYCFEDIYGNKMWTPKTEVRK